MIIIRSSMVNMYDVKEKGQQTLQTERPAMDRVFSKKLACSASHTSSLGGYHYKYNAGMSDAVSSIPVQFQLIYWLSVCVITRASLYITKWWLHYQAVFLLRTVINCLNLSSFLQTKHVNLVIDNGSKSSMVNSKISIKQQHLFYGMKISFQRKINIFRLVSVIKKNRTPCLTSHKSHEKI